MGHRLKCILYLLCIAWPILELVPIAPSAISTEESQNLNAKSDKPSSNSTVLRASITTTSGSANKLPNSGAELQPAYKGKPTLNRTIDDCWELINEWEAGTWKRVSMDNIVVKDYTIDFSESKKEKIGKDKLALDRGLNSESIYGHVIDVKGRIWHCYALTDRWLEDEKYSSKMFSVAHELIEPTIRDKKHVKTHFLITYGEQENGSAQNSGNITIDTLAEMFPLQDGRISRKTVTTQFDGHGRLLKHAKTTQIWKRVCKFQGNRLVNSELKKSFERYQSKK